MGERDVYDDINRFMVARAMKSFLSGTNLSVLDLASRMRVVEVEAQADLDPANVHIARQIRNTDMGGVTVACMLERVGSWQQIEWWVPMTGDESSKYEDIYYLGRYELPSHKSVAHGA